MPDVQDVGMCLLRDVCMYLLQDVGMCLVMRSDWIHPIVEREAGLSLKLAESTHKLVSVSELVGLECTVDDSAYHICLPISWDESSKAEGFDVCRSSIDVRN